MKEGKKRGWFSSLMSDADGCRGRLWGSVVLSVVSVTAGLIPFFCVYRILQLFIAGRLISRLR